jgi:hypothetical protein
VALLLAVTLFYKFNRLLSLRNWDLLMLFLMVPPLLYLRESRDEKSVALAALSQDEIQFATLPATFAVADPAVVGPAYFAALSSEEFRVRTALRVSATADKYLQADRDVWRAYLWLLLASAYWLLRCLLDLTLVRRPIFQPNLNVWGLGFLGTALLIILSLRTLLPPTEPIPGSRTQSVLLERAASAAVQAAERITPVPSNLPVSVSPGTTTQSNPATASSRLAGISREDWFRGMIATLCHIVVITGLIWIGAWHFQDLGSGMAAAVLYLLLPYTAYQGWDLQHALPAALLVAAVALYRYPLLAGLCMGTASSLVFFPLLLLPLWFSFYRRRGALRFLAAAGFVLTCAVIYLWMDEELRPQLLSALGWNESAAAPEANWRAWNPSAAPTAEGLWTGLALHYAYRLPLFIAYLALIIVTAVRPSPKNLAHLLAISGALVLGIQFWYADAGGIYVLWYLPFLVLLLFRPNLAEKFPAQIDPAADWLNRSLHWAKRRWFTHKVVEPAVKAAG